MPKIASCKLMFLLRMFIICVTWSVPPRAPWQSVTGLLPQGEQSVLSACVVDVDVSDTVLLCTSSGVLVEMHLESLRVARSWDLGSIIGQGHCEGVAWTKEVGVGGRSHA